MTAIQELRAHEKYAVVKKIIEANDAAFENIKSEEAIKGYFYDDQDAQDFFDAVVKVRAQLPRGESVSLDSYLDGLEESSEAFKFFKKYAKKILDVIDEVDFDEQNNLDAAVDDIIARTPVLPPPPPPAGDPPPPPPPAGDPPPYSSLPDAASDDAYKPDDAELGFAAKIVRFSTESPAEPSAEMRDLNQCAEKLKAKYGDNLSAEDIIRGIKYHGSNPGTLADGEKPLFERGLACLPGMVAHHAQNFGSAFNSMPGISFSDAGKEVAKFEDVFDKLLDKYNGAEGKEYTGKGISVETGYKAEFTPTSGDGPKVTVDVTLDKNGKLQEARVSKYDPDLYRMMLESAVLSVEDPKKLKVCGDFPDAEARKQAEEMLKETVDKFLNKELTMESISMPEELPGVEADDVSEDVGPSPP